MQIIKSHLQKQFNEAALSYDRHCMVQQHIAKHAINILIEHQKAFNCIADFACGTGESMRFLIDSIAFNQGYAIDFSEQSLIIAKNKLSHAAHLDWICHDFEKPINKLGSLDLIFCNMGLQWSCDIENTIKLWRQYANVNAYLLCTLPLADNFFELRERVKPVFLNHTELLSMINNAGWSLISCDFKQYQVSYSHQLEALKALKAMGTQYNPNKKYINKLNQIFISADVSTLTYSIGFYLLRNDI